MLKIILTLLAGLYALSPFDALPEMMTGWMGWIDDLLVLYLLWRFYYRQGAGQGRNGRPFASGPRGRTGGRRENPGAGGDRRGEPPRDPYTILGVSRDAAPEEIRKAYKRLAGQYHPDKVNHLAPEFRELAEKRFKEIQAAYDAIGRP